ncbi:hypothetical protein [Sediminibacterium sp.]|uniref:hypothetical protein n=1 Tax=Sediminibacterium sp. TaxID=1917865 RepID=UPI00272EEA03|nr:hypothetical protein [Sediminibacterium sp.]MDP2421416.1 hypothetical protein [Sediminibacterium sp.]
MKYHLTLPLLTERNAPFQIAYPGSMYGRFTSTLITIVAFLFTGSLMAQNKSRSCPVVIAKQDRLFNLECDSTIRNIAYHKNSGKIDVRVISGNSFFIETDSIWGIRTKNNLLVRFVNGKAYQLNDTSGIIRYMVKTGKQRGYYFSTGINSEIYELNRSELQSHTDIETYKAFAQKSNIGRHEIYSAVSLTNNNIADRRVPGVGLELGYYLTEKFATGIGFSGTWAKSTDSFSYMGITPEVAMTTIGWLNRYEFVQTRTVRAGIDLVTGLAVSTLFDGSKKEWVKTRYGWRDRSIKLRESCYFLLDPGLSVTAKLFSLGTKETGVCLTGKTNYRILAGRPQFGSRGTFSGYSFAVGIAVYGFNREKL